jgi:RHS repeat-associated protein
VYDPNYFLYDGHGSTRQLVQSDGTTITDSFSYDAYGVMLGGNPAPGSSPATSLLYAGEHFDTDSQHYYLRARYYDPLNGRFNRMDPYPGSPQDPQSLHKYLYANCNPINSIDPTGRFSLAVNIALGVAVFAVVFTIGYSIKKAIVNSIMTSGSTVISPGTSKYRYIEVSLSLLEDAVNIPNSGVNQSDVTGLRNMLVSGKVYDYAKGTFGKGLYARGNIYVGLPAIIELVLANLPSNQTSFTNSDYPDKLGYYFTYYMASTLFHEWQHHNYGAGAFREKTVNSSNWQKTYGKEVKLANAIINHLQSDPTTVHKDLKIKDLNLVIYAATKPVD